jgi:hypothetical protein
MYEHDHAYPARGTKVARGGFVCCGSSDGVAHEGAGDVGASYVGADGLFHSVVRRHCDARQHCDEGRRCDERCCTHVRRVDWARFHEQRSGVGNDERTWWSDRAIDVWAIDNWAQRAEWCPSDGVYPDVE